MARPLAITGCALDQVGDAADVDLNSLVEAALRIPAERGEDVLLPNDAKIARLDRLARRFHLLEQPVNAVVASVEIGVEIRARR